MENGKNNLSSSIITLVEKFASLYFEYLTRRNMDEKLGLGGSLVKWGYTLLGAIVFATISWVSLMGLLFIYLQSLHLSVVIILSIVLTINVSLFFITILGVSQANKTG